MEIPYVILDIRGLMLYSLMGGKDPNAKFDEKGNSVNTAEYGTDRFIEFFLLPMLEISDPRNIIAVWDGGNEYRKALFPGYKLKRGQREYTAVQTGQIEEIEFQIKDILRAIGCTQTRVNRVEADDVVAFLCERLPGVKFVYTVDQDLLQLDNETTHIMYQGAMAKENPELPEFKYVRITKSLLGDTSDEYPGVIGFGEKKLEAIINEFGQDALDDIEECVSTKNYAPLQEALQVAQDPQARKGLELLLEDTRAWHRQYMLASLHPELCVEPKNKIFPELKWDKAVPNYHTLQQALFNCRREDLLTKLQKYTPSYELVTNANWDSFADRFMSAIEETPFFAFDYESYDTLQHKPFNEALRSGGFYVDVLSQSITGMSICYGRNLENIAYVSVDHRDTDNVPDEYLKDILETVQENGKALVAHNAPFEIALTDTNFLYSLGQVHDTRLMAAYVDEEDSHHLKDLSKRWLNYLQTSYAQTLEKAGVDNMLQISGEEVLNYGCDDSVVTAHLYDLFTLILKLEGTLDFCLDQETATNAVLYDSFEKGMHVDYDRLKQLAEEDAASFEQNMATLRNVLLVNCNKRDDNKAKELYNELSEFEKKKMNLDNTDEDVIEKKLLALKERLESGTRYEPLVEEPPEVKFIPTAHQINKLVKKEFDWSVELGGVTANKVTEFLLELDESPNRVEYTQSERAFLDALGDCSEQLKGRDGPEFENFVDLCKGMVAKGMKPVTSGDELNLDSSPQMQVLLYCKLGLPIRLHGKVHGNSTRAKLGYDKGSPSTDDKAIDMALAEDCPDTEEGRWKRMALTSLREAKAANTRYKNYWRPYPLWRHPRDGNVHGSISNCGTVTKRFTGSNPNFLQLSGKDGGRVRSIVLPYRDDHVILSPDFNGEELRITASLSHDPVMVDAYMGANKKDLHSITAASIAGAVLHLKAPGLVSHIEWEEVDGMQTMGYDTFLSWLASDDKDTADIFKNIRKLAKGVNFLLIYVGGPSTLARNLGVPTETAEQFLKATMNVYARLSPWQQESIEFAKTHGYVLTSYGNRRHIGNGIFSKDKGVRTRLERQAVNSQVQGTGSDIMKVVMKEMYDRKMVERLDASLIVAPYDELAVSVPRAAAWDCWLEMQEIMTLTPPGHLVPQMPELKAGALNWGGMIEMGAFPTEDQFNALLDEQISKQREAA